MHKVAAKHPSIHSTWVLPEASGERAKPCACSALFFLHCCHAGSERHTYHGADVAPRHSAADSEASRALRDDNLPSKTQLPLQLLFVSEDFVGIFVFYFGFTA